MYSKRLLPFFHESLHMDRFIIIIIVMWRFLFGLWWQCMKDPTEQQQELLSRTTNEILFCHRHGVRLRESYCTTTMFFSFFVFLEWRASHQRLEWRLEKSRRA
jgi:hypothetical protein